MDKENLKLKSKEAQLRVLSQVLTASERDGAIESLPDDPDALEETNANESSAAKVRQGCLLQWLCWGVFFFFFFFFFVCLFGWLVGWLVGWFGPSMFTCKRDERRTFDHYLVAIPCCTWNHPTWVSLYDIHYSRRGTMSCYNLHAAKRKQ